MHLCGIVLGDLIDLRHIDAVDFPDQIHPLALVDEIEIP